MLNKKNMGLILCGALLAAYLVASPYYHVYKLKVAVTEKDSTLMSTLVDFESVRQSLKDQFNVYMLQEMGEKEESSPFGMLGVAFMGAFVDKAVDAYVTPSGLGLLMQGQAPKGLGKSTAAGSPPEEALEAVEQGNAMPDTSMGYKGLNRFELSAESAEGEDIVFVLSRDFLSWKVTEILIPFESY